MVVLCVVTYLSFVDPLSVVGQNPSVLDKRQVLYLGYCLILVSPGIQ